MRQGAWASSLALVLLAGTLAATAAVAEKHYPRGQVDEAIAALQKYDAGVLKIALREIGLLAAPVGFRVKTFKEIEFDDLEWDRSGPEDGCVTYTSTRGSSDVKIIKADGTEQAHNYPADRKVLVCGNTVHLPP